jgi:hypothetical protein
VLAERLLFSIRSNINNIESVDELKRIIYVLSGNTVNISSSLTDLRNSLGRVVDQQLKSVGASSYIEIDREVYSYVAKLMNDQLAMFSSPALYKNFLTTLALFCDEKINNQLEH